MFSLIMKTRPNKINYKTECGVPYSVFVYRKNRKHIDKEHAFAYNVKSDIYLDIKYRR